MLPEGYSYDNLEEDKRNELEYWKNRFIETVQISTQMTIDYMETNISAFDHIIDEIVSVVEADLYKAIDNLIDEHIIYFEDKKGENEDE